MARWTAALTCLAVLTAPVVADDPLPAGASARLGVSRFLNFGRTFAVAYTPDGKTLAGAAWDGSVRVWDVATGQERWRTAAHPGWTKLLAFSPDGKVLVTTGKDCIVRFWDAANGKPLRQLSGFANEVLTLEFEPEGKQLLTRCWDQQRGYDHRLWDAADGREVRRFEDKGKRIGYIAFSPDGQALAVIESTPGNREGGMRLEDRATGKELRRFSAASERVAFGWARGLAFSPDGRTLAFGGAEQKVFLWDVASGRELGSVGGQGDVFTAFAFSPNGRSLATVGDHCLVQVWELASRKGRRRFQAPEHTDSCVAFSPDGRSLATGSLDTTVLLWSVAPQKSAKIMTEADLQASWRLLEAADAVSAYEAIGKLTAAADQTVPFLKIHLQPAAGLDPQRAAKAVRDLDSNQFAVREKAHQELEKLGDLAEPLLLKVQQDESSAEVRRRVQQLIEKVGADRAALSGDRLRLIRAVEVLELIGSPEARGVLQALAKGAPEAWLTREAAQSLKRVARR